MKKRGIYCDVGHGGGSFAWTVAAPIIRGGYLPDSISTDLNVGSMNNGMKDLLNVADKLMLLGETIPEVVAEMTSHPAHEIGQEQLGNLSVRESVPENPTCVASRGGGLPLLLSSIFHIGNASNSISWDTYQHFARHPAVAWTIPISMGDSYHGYRVLATDDNFYSHYQYRRDKSLSFAQGHAPEGIFDVVLGAEVGQRLHDHMGEQIVLAHGIEDKSIFNHLTTPFTVVGILAPTATPVDRAVYITLLGDEAMHFGWSGGTPPAIGEASPKLDPSKLKIDEITCFLLGAKSRVSTLYLTARDQHLQT